MEFNVITFLNTLLALSAILLVGSTTGFLYLGIVKRIEIWRSLKRDWRHWVGGTVPLVVVGILYTWMPLGDANAKGQDADAERGDTKRLLAWWSALWAVGLIMLSTVVSCVPGRVVGFPPQCARYLKVSPILCAFDVANVLWEIVAEFSKAVWGRQSRSGRITVMPAESVRGYVGKVLEEIAERKFGALAVQRDEEERVESSHLHDVDGKGSGRSDEGGGTTDAATTKGPASAYSCTHTAPPPPLLPGRARAAALLVGTLHPAAVLFSCKGAGVIMTQTIAGCYLISAWVDEALFLVHSRRTPVQMSHEASFRKADDGSATVYSTPSSTEDTRDATRGNPHLHAIPSLNNSLGVGRFIVSCSLMSAALCVSLWTSVSKKHEMIRTSMVSLMSLGGMLVTRLADRGKLAPAPRWKFEVVNMFDIAVSMQCVANLVEKPSITLPWWSKMLPWLIGWLCAVACIYFAMHNAKHWAKYDADEPRQPPVFTFAVTTIFCILVYYYVCYDASATYKPNAFEWILTKNISF